MPVPPRHSSHAPEEAQPLSSTDTSPRKPVGRPPGAPSTIVNLRLPIDLLAQLDRYIDRLEVQTGLQANRGMIARRALEEFLATPLAAPHASSW
jgi:hypothetical protein